MLVKNNATDFFVKNLFIYIQQNYNIQSVKIPNIISIKLLIVALFYGVVEVDAAFVELAIEEVEMFKSEFRFIRQGLTEYNF